jgi:hypothetical protein
MVNRLDGGFEQVSSCDKGIFLKVFLHETNVNQRDSVSRDLAGDQAEVPLELLTNPW